MKKLIIITAIASLALLNSCDEKKKLSTDVVEAAPTSVKFSNPKHNFGKIEEGEKISYEYEYKNTGKNALVISMVTTPCGCTTPEYSKDPLDPGKTEYIKVTFDSKNKYGKQNKELTVIANTTPPESVIEFTVEVEDKKK
ncbi:MAG: DUF1573 domain-containing protein [Bacteroidetes bacterium]|nr:DUF1573 domain-containing protein [Bacteroidota bacterium]